MKTQAAVIVEPGKGFRIEELDLSEPGPGEVLLRYAYSGLCHSDLHILQGDSEARLPLVGGHEGSAVVQKVGPGVTRVREGDHVVCSFIPNCGTCRWCATGQQALCDLGANALVGNLPGDRFVFTGEHGQYGGMNSLGTFSEYGVVHQNSVVPIPKDIPLDKAALVSCGVPSGWGSAVYAADVRAGETVIVYGIGGIGSNAVQGARHAGAANIIAVDPEPFKRETAMQLGATHAVAEAAEAAELARDLTLGVGADKAIVTVGHLEESVTSAAFEAIRKGGTAVVTSMGVLEDTSVTVPGTILALFKKTLRGTLFGDCNPTYDIPRLLFLYQQGQLVLDALITRTYDLGDVNQGYEDLKAGKNIRGLIKH
ncbi:NDMA-dependent alcohol dehydrogenase [Citricoccus sp. NPDC055426]|uniref:NDMA-dependent alcohol dehydrogenase n=1 Tax=Citricoccus sp. NPDC055426 TaxID=3155536 RepID=UPI00342EDAEB